MGATLRRKSLPMNTSVCCMIRTRGTTAGRAYAEPGEQKMSMHAPLFYAIPEQTAQIAHAAFPKGNPYMRMRDLLGPIYTNPEFASLFSKEGQPAEARTSTPD